MKSKIAEILSGIIPLDKAQIESLIEIPPNNNLGDYAFPCFILSKQLKKSPADIASDLAKKIKSEYFEKVESKGPYLNFFIEPKSIVNTALTKILKEKEKYGSSKLGNGKTMIIDMSSPNIAKPFGIGHLRSTLIGNSISKIYSFMGFKTIKINYLGDWGTPFGKIIAGYEKWGSEKKLKEQPIKHLYEIYVKASEDSSFEEIGREYFKKLESGDKKLLSLWNNFRKESINDFKRIYSLLNVEFDVYSGESRYNEQLNQVIQSLEKKKLLEKSEEAMIVDLEKYNLGVGLIQKTDGTTLYLTRDIAAAIERYNKYKFNQMLYEVGAEQKLHFKQLFKVLELMGYKWASECKHIAHGFYLDSEGKKFATRKGKTIFMEDVLDETKELAKKEIEKREKLNKEELEKRAISITRAAIIYGDLKNYREHDAIFDIQKFLSFEGNTGPYLLYTYARARSILRKAEYTQKKYSSDEITPQEKNLIVQLSKFSEIVEQAYTNLSPNIIANYAFNISQLFNEFYHSEKVIGSENQQFKLTIVDALSQVLSNALSLLGIQPLEKM